MGTTPVLCLRFRLSSLPLPETVRIAIGRSQRLSSGNLGAFPFTKSAIRTAHDGLFHVFSLPHQETVRCSVSRPTCWSCCALPWAGAVLPFLTQPFIFVSGSSVNIRISFITEKSVCKSFERITASCRQLHHHLPRKLDINGLHTLITTSHTKRPKAPLALFRLENSL